MGWMMFLKKKEKDVTKNTIFFKEMSQASKAEVITKIDGDLAGLKKSKVEEKQKIYGKNIFAKSNFV